MPNIFHPAMNTISRVTIFGALGFVAMILGILWVVVRTPYVTEAGVIREQPVPFSHQHHVGDIGIDCRYCHNSVEESSYAGLPSTSVCMTCHSWLYNDQEMLEPVRDSWTEGKPLEWTRVHDLADYAHFPHDIHISKGVGCVTCHGKVDEMPLMWREHSLLMEWCLDCHREPVKNLRPREFIFRTETLDELTETSEFQEYLVREFPEFAEGEVNLTRLQAALADQYGVKSKMNCSICHY